jgi:hypothetical protein
MLKLRTGSLKGRHALMAEVLFSFSNELLFIFVAKTLEVGLNIIYPLLVQEAVTFLNSPTAPVNVGYGLLGGFFCVSLGIAVSQVHLLGYNYLLIFSTESWSPLGPIT